MRFISEPIEPEAGSFDPSLLATGLGSLPAAFHWRGRRYAIVDCLEHSKISSPEGGRPGAERYLRRQEFRVRLDTGEEATVYLLRHAPRGSTPRQAKKRWFLYTIASKSSGA